MDRTSPPPARRRRVSLFAVIGVVLLVASVAGANLALNSHAGDGSARSAAEPTAPTNSSAQGAVCIAYVDAEHGTTPLYPLQPGRVAEVLVEENVEVEAGTPLFRMEDTPARQQVEEAEAALAAAEVRLAEARKLPTQHARKLAAQKAAVEAAKAELGAAQAQRDKARRFHQEKIGGSVEDTRAAEGVAARAEAAVKAEEAKLAVLEVSDPRNAVRLAEQDVKAKRVQLEKAKFALKECTVRAPYKGKVLRSLVSPGEALGPNPRQPAMVFCPSGPRVVRAEVEQVYASRVAEGQVALIQDEATNSGNWRGRVKRVSDWYTHRRSVLQEPLQYNDVRTLECIIELDPNQPPLRIGQRVRVKLEGVDG